MKYIFSIFILLSLIGTSGVLVHAQTGGTQSSGSTGGGTQSGTQAPTGAHLTLVNPIRYNNLLDLMKAIVDNILLPIGGIVATIFFILAGFKYVMAQGNPTEIGKANKSLLYTVIGTAVLLGAWVIVNVLEATIKSIQ